MQLALTGTTAKNLTKPQRTVSRVSLGINWLMELVPTPAQVRSLIRTVPLLQKRNVSTVSLGTMLNWRLECVPWSVYGVKPMRWPVGHAASVKLDLSCKMEPVLNLLWGLINTALSMMEPIARAVWQDTNSLVPCVKKPDKMISIYFKHLSLTYSLKIFVKSQFAFVNIKFWDCNKVY